MVRTAARGSYEVAEQITQTFDDDGDGRRLEEAHVTERFAGDMDATGPGRLLLVRNPSGSASACGLVRLDGTIDGRGGSFVFQLDGSRDALAWQGVLHDVPESSGGDLRRLRGEGTWRRLHDGSDSSWTLEFWFE